MKEEDSGTELLEKEAETLELAPPLRASKTREKKEQEKMPTPYGFYPHPSYSLGNQGEKGEGEYKKMTHFHIKTPTLLLFFVYNFVYIYISSLTLHDLNNSYTIINTINILHIYIYMQLGTTTSKFIKSQFYLNFST